MMRYFRLLDDVYLPDRWHLGAVVGDVVAAPRLTVGMPQVEQTFRTSVTRAGRALDFTLTSFAVPVARAHLARAVETVVGEDVQQLPVFVNGQSGFAILNFLRLVRCLDEGRSEFVKWTAADHRPDLAGQYRMVTRLKVNPALVPLPLDAFRIEGWAVAVVVSDRLKAVMEAAGCRGAIFQDIT